MMSIIYFLNHLIECFIHFFKIIVNLFLQVIIHSHHGKEHYCPLSVIRVLGYSMVETLEDIEHDENNIDSG